MMDKNILEVKDLNKSFKSKGHYIKAVDGISFTIKKGETFSIVGQSGSGKSTTGRLIVRLIEADSGEIYFKEERISDLSKKEFRSLRPEIQMIFQDPYSSLNPRMNIKELLKEAISIDKSLNMKEINSRCEELITSVGLEINDLQKYPHQLSGGQRQRISIARAIANNPSIIICDEPVSALDLLVQAQMLNLLKELQKKYNFTYIFISHDLSVVKHMSDRIAIMYKGSIVEEGCKDNIFKDAKHPYTKLLLESTLSLEDQEQSALDYQQNDNKDTEKSNCKFAGKCPSFNKGCILKEIELKKISKTHKVACTMYY